MLLLTCIKTDNYLKRGAERDLVNAHIFTNNACALYILTLAQ